jgi:hypothetical protein
VCELCEIIHVYRKKEQNIDTYICVCVCVCLLNENFFYILIFLCFGVFQDKITTYIHANLPGYIYKCLTEAGSMNLELFLAVCLVTSQVRYVLFVYIQHDFKKCDELSVILGKTRGVYISSWFVFIFR